MKANYTIAIFFLELVFIFQSGLANYDITSKYKKNDKQIILHNIYFEDAQYSKYYDIVSDSLGYVYIATGKGVYIFDGLSVKPLKDDTVNDCIYFYKNKKSEIFAFPFNGKLLKLSFENKKFDRASRISICNDTTPKYRVFTCFESKKGTHFFLIKIPNQNTSIYYLKGNCLIKFEKFNNVFDKEIEINEAFKYFNQLLLDSCEAKKDISLRRKITNTFYKNLSYKNSLFTANCSVYDVNNNFEEIMNIETYSKIYSFDFCKNGYSHVRSGKNTLILLSDSIKSYLYKDNEFLTTINDTEITGLEEDIYGNIYLLSRTNGLKVIFSNEVKTEVKKIPDIVKNDLINAIKLNDGSYLFSDIYGNLFLNKYNNFEEFRLENKKTSKFIIPYINYNAINNELSIVTAYSYFKLDPEKKNISKISNAITDARLVRHIYEENDTVFVISKTSNSVIAPKQTISYMNKNIANNVFAYKDTFFIASSNGIEFVTKYNFKENKKYYTNTILDNNVISKIEKNENYIVASILGSVYIIANNKLIAKLDDTYFNNFFCTSNKIICVANNKINVYDFNGQLVNYTNLPSTYVNDGILFSSFNATEIIVHKKDYIYIYNLNALIQPMPKANLIITGISYENKKLTNTTFKYKGKVPLEINYDILNSIDIDNISAEIYINDKFLYSLNEIKDHKIKLYNLEPAQYHIKIKKQKIEIGNLNFTITPAYYQTTLFYTLAFILLSTIIYFISFKIIKIRNQKKETESQLLALESKSKTNQLKSHFIFNALLPLQNYILREKKGEALSYLNQFSKLMRSILKMNNASMVTLHDEIDFLTQYLEIQQQEKNNTFSYSINLDEKLKNKATIIKLPTLILQPVVENALNYGMSENINTKGIIEISFTLLNENTLKVNVFDNGNGFRKNKSIDYKKNNHALDIIEKRLSILHNDNTQKFINYEIQSNGFIVSITISLK